MRTSLLNTFFSLVLTMTSFSAFAFKGVGTGTNSREEFPMNQPAFENTETRLDGGTVFHDVAIIPECDQNKIKLVDNGVEISFYAKESVCANLISDIGWGNCPVRAGSALVENVSYGFGALTRYEITQVDHFKEGCDKVKKVGGKAY